MVGIVVAREGSLGFQTSRREVQVIEDEVPHVYQRDGEDSLPDYSYWSSHCVPVVELESMAAGVVSPGERIELLTTGKPKPESGCSGTAAAPWVEC